MYCNLKKRIIFLSQYLVSVIEQQRSISIKFDPFDITELCIIWKFKQLNSCFISGLWLAIQGPELSNMFNVKVNTELLIYLSLSIKKSRIERNNFSM